MVNFHMGMTRRWRTDCINDAPSSTMKTILLLMTPRIDSLLEQYIVLICILYSFLFFNCNQTFLFSSTRHF